VWVTTWCVRSSTGSDTKNPVSKLSLRGKMASVRRRPVKPDPNRGQLDLFRSEQLAHLKALREQIASVPDGPDISLERRPK
jgi:hypothetical protein